MRFRFSERTLLQHTAMTGLPMTIQSMDLIFSSFERSGSGSVRKAPLKISTDYC